MATLGASLACHSESKSPSVPVAQPAASLLAVGDTGEPWGPLPLLFEGQLAVGAAMQREHERAPVDALVLLGDNFYPDGLLAHELIPRIVENVARPYCAFIEPSAELARHWRGDCSPVRRPAPRLFVVLGNHDLMTPGSLELQRNEVPRFVLNWEVPAEASPAVRELPGGLSLIFLDTEWPWASPDVDALAAALETARGPWRVVVGHRPPIAGHPQLSKMVERAAHQSGRIVHAYLSGHVHGLAAIRGAGDAPTLTVIAGSGSEVDLQSAPEYRIDDADVVAEVLGFVRLDAFPETGPARTPAHLRITLLEARPSAALAFLGRSEVARYEIQLDGSIERVRESAD
jgi:Calcineurin-like phosphoesterase